MGAKESIVKPAILDAPAPNKANPVPLIETFIASFLFFCIFNSCLNLSVIWIEKSKPTPIETAPIVAVTKFNPNPKAYMMAYNHTTISNKGKTVTNE